MQARVLFYTHAQISILCFTQKYSPVGGVIGKARNGKFTGAFDVTGASHVGVVPQ